MIQKRFHKIRCAVLAGVMILAGCSTIPDTTERLQRMESQGGASRFIQDYVGDSSGRIFTSSRITDPSQTTRIYIEGDGFAYITGEQASPDPTPLKPVLFAMAASDPGANVVYMGRPCQYGHDACTLSDWTANRFSEKNRVAINAAIDAVKARHHLGNIELVGYSGGAHFAAILAATRCDVVGLRSVAGNLDVPSFVKLHHLDTLNVSDTGLSHADALREVPQSHLVSSDDRVIPPVLVQGFVSALANPEARIHIVSGPTHSEGWQAVWPRFIAESLPQAHPDLYKSHLRCTAP